MHKSIVSALALTFALATGTTQAAEKEPVRIADVIELSGAGATVGTNWRDAVVMAIDEINEAGGILGRQIAVEHYDTQSNPGVSRAQVQKALDTDPYAIVGPIYSGSVKVNNMLAQRAGVPQFVGAEGAGITSHGNPYLFRTSLSQAASMPKLANYIRDRIGAKSIAIVWINNDFGRGGRDAFVKEMEERGIKVVADISTEVGQTDYAPDIINVTAARPDALFVYLNEEESARFLREARKQGVEVPILGETTLLNQKVIELAGEAANGVRGHLGLSADAPVEGLQDFAGRFEARYGYKPDHNAIKGYMAVYTIKEITERVGGFDQEKFVGELHGATITPEDEPGILMTTTWDEKGDVDRISFLAEVVDGHQEITETLPPLSQSK